MMRATIGDDSLDNAEFTEEDISIAIRRKELNKVDLNNKSARSVAPSVDMTNIYPAMSMARNVEGNRFAVKHAIVAKQCPTMPLLWQDRFFVLKTDGSIYYYLNEAAYNANQEPKGCILLSDLKKNRTSENGMYDSIVVHGDRMNISVNSKNGRVYRLRFESASHASTWRDALYAHITHLLAGSNGNL